MATRAADLSAEGACGSVFRCLRFGVSVPAAWCFGVSVIEERKVQCEAADSFALTEVLKH